LPFSWSGDPEHELPPGGYDAVLLRAAGDRLKHRDLLSLVEIALRPGVQKSGLAGIMLTAVRSAAAEHGYRSVVPASHQGAPRPDVRLAEYVR
jgi:hypothetical protein